MPPAFRTPIGTVTIAAPAVSDPAAVSSTTPRPFQRIALTGVESRTGTSAPQRVTSAP
jgi:hypothetical protein